MSAREPLLWLLPLAGLALGYPLGARDGDASAAVSSARSPMPRAEEAALVSASTGPRQSLAQPAASASRSLAQLRSLPSEMHRLAELARLLNGFSPADFATHVDEILAQITYDDFELLKLYFARWSQVAPEAAARRAMAERWQRGRILQGAFYAAIMTLGESDPAKAEEIMAGARFPSSVEIRRNLRGLALAKLRQEPPEEAFRRLQQMQDAQSEAAIRETATAILDRWYDQDPEAAWRAALAMSSDGSKKWIRENALDALVTARTKAHPAEMRAWVQSLSPGPERDRWQQRVLGGLLELGDFTQAREYAASLSDPQQRRQALGSITMVELQRIADPDAILAKLGTLTADEWNRFAFFGPQLRKVMQQRPEETLQTILAHASDMPGGKIRPGLLQYVFEDWSQNDPRAAADFLSQRPAATFGPALDRTLMSWGQRDPQSMAGWALEKTTGETQRKAITVAVMTWSQNDSLGASRWLESLPAGGAKTAATEAFAGSTMSLAPDDALAWIRTLPDCGDRLKSLRRVWSYWNDRAAAERWRDESPELTAQERAALQ